VINLSEVQVWAGNQSILVENSSTLISTIVSNLYGKVYVSTNLKKVVVNFRGTKEATDRRIAA